MNIVCENCGENISEKNDDKLKLRTNILIFKNNKCEVKCHKCKKFTNVPIFLDLSKQSKSSSKMKHIIIEKNKNKQ